MDAIEIPAASIISGKVTEVTIAIPEAYQDAWVVLASSDVVKKSRQLYVKVGRPRKPRTTGYRSQNHAINGYIQQICKYTGEDFADVKLYAKRKAMRRGLPAMQKEDGAIIYSRNDGEPLPMSEKDMNTEQASWVIDELRIIADEIGIVLSDGNMV